MCGIAGIAERSERATLNAIVGRQLATLRHRGPDSQGTWGNDRGVIGQRRLAVIDLETGDPPITDEAGRICAVLNGEIYNFVALRAELMAQGHRLSSRGDTEVIAHLAEDLKPVDLARRLNGMFAFACWDARGERLVLGRDRLGKKPLYYWHGDGRLVFGSEIKAVLADSRVPRHLNQRAIPAYLTFGYVPTPETFFDGIKSVPPGHVLSFRAGGEPVLERYWQLATAGIDGVQPHDVTLEEAADTVRRLVVAAVQRRMVADVPLGAFLSGGIDSSGIVAIMSTLTERPVRTFTMGFSDAQLFDERPYARLVAERYGTDHHEHVVTADATELIETLLWHHDQPFGDSSAIPTYLVSEATRQDVTVALSGDGGDELFGGYERFAAAAALHRYRRLPTTVRGLIRAGVDHLQPSAISHRAESAQRFTRYVSMATEHAYRSWLSFFDEERRHEALADPDDWALRDYDRIWRGSEGADLITRLLDLNARTYLLDDLLVKIDRASMAHGLEVRSPLLDVDLAEYAFRLPPDLKIRRFALKRVLGVALAQDLPASVINRRKRGFAVPLDDWFRGELKALVEDRLGSPTARVRRHIRGTVIDNLIREHASASRNHGQALWMLLTLELFLRREDW